MFATRCGNLGIVQVLLAVGPEVNKADNDGNTPLHKASYYGRSKVVKVLLAAGADVNTTTNHRDIPLHITSSYWSL